MKWSILLVFSILIGVSIDQYRDFSDESSSRYSLRNPSEVQIQSQNIPLAEESISETYLLFIVSSLFAFVLISGESLIKKKSEIQSYNTSTEKNGLIKRNRFLNFRNIRI